MVWNTDLDHPPSGYTDTVCKKYVEGHIIFDFPVVTLKKEKEIGEIKLNNVFL